MGWDRRIEKMKIIEKTKAVDYEVVILWSSYAIDDQNRHRTRLYPLV